MADLLKKLPKKELENASKRSMPKWMDPMLAKLTHDYFSGDEWIFERKLDGERVISYVEPRGKIRLMSRNKKEINDSYPEIEEALTDLAPRSCVVDGEVVAFDKNKVSDFQRLQPRMHASSREESRKSGVKVYYCLLYTSDAADE